MAGPASPKKLTRKERERLTRRLEILTAAESIFAEKGYHLASIAEIAAAAEFAPGTVYLYFDSKEAIYAAVFEHKISAMLTLVGDRVAQSSDAEARLCDLVSAQLEFYEQNSDFFRIFTSSRLDATGIKENWDGVWKLYSDFLQLIEDVVKSGQNEKSFRQGESSQYALALMGVVNTLVRGWLETGSKDSLTNQNKFIVDFVLNGMGE